MPMICLPDDLKQYELGTPFIRNYPPREYKGFSQNWDAVQDKNGVMYFANGDGVLEYDGINWRLIRVGQNYTVMSLGIDEDGVIYVGAINEFGILVPNFKGEMTYYSLSDKLPEETHSFGFIYRFIIYNKNQIFLTTSRGIYKLYFDEYHTSLKKIEQVQKVFSVENLLFFQSFTEGLFVYYNDTILPLNGGDFFSKKSINNILPYDQNRLLVSVADTMMYLINKPTHSRLNEKITIQAFPTQIDGFLVTNRYNHSLRLHNGNFAFATTKRGTVIIDKKGKIVQILNKTTGVYNDTHFRIFQDAENALWMCLDNGISKVETNSPLSFWNDASGLKGSVMAITRFNNMLYVGTWQGVYYLDIEKTMRTFDAQVPLEPLFFSAIKEINNTAWAFLEINNQDGDNVLLIATADGIYAIQGGNIIQVFDKPVNNLYHLKNPNNIILAGLDNGVLPIRFSFNNNLIQFEIKPTIEGVNERIISIGQTPGGNIWLGTQYNGLFLLTLPCKDQQYDTLLFQAHSFKTYNNQSLIGSIYISEFNNQLYFTCNTGVFVFLNNDKAFKPLSVFINNFIADNIVISIFKQLTKNSVLLQFNRPQKGEKTIAELTIKNGQYHLITYPFKPIPEAEIWAIYSDNNNVIWLGGDEGLFRHNKNVNYLYDKTFQTAIRRVVLENDSILYGGHNYHINTFFYQCPIMHNDYKIKPEIEFVYNSLGFEFASLFFYDEAQNKYQYQLLGFDKKPSEWVKITKKEYTNLSPGKYTFIVRSKNIFEKESDWVTFDFIILPPWYRTYWTYTMYLVLLGVFVFLIIRYSNIRLRQTKLRLEKIVSDRTSEIIAQKRELEKEKEKSDRLLLNILPYKIAEELKENGFAKAKYYQSVSVLFADFSGFTQISEQLEPEDLIKELDKCFVHFDEVCVRNNLEKIKTVGDSYMCAGGVPIKNNSHPIDIVIAALEIVKFIKSLDADHIHRNISRWRIRIGINTGEVIAGVVGKKKFAYDIWGDTVNTASRMESTSQPNKINITGSTYEYVKDFFECTYRGKVPAKHKGEVDMYFVERIKPELSNDDDGFVPNILFKEKYNNFFTL